MDMKIDLSESTTPRNNGVVIKNNTKEKALSEVLKNKAIFGALKNLADK